MSASEEGRRVMRLSLLIRAGSAPVTALVGVANSALVVAATGAPLFGVITLVSTVAQQLPFADLGLGGIVTTSVARSRLAQNSSENSWQTIARALRVLILVSAVVTLTALALTTYGMWPKILSYPLTGADQWLVFVAVAVFALNIPLSLGQRIVTGLGRNELVVISNIASSFMILLVTAVLALSGATGMAFALPAMVGPFVVNLVISIIVAVTVRRGASAGIRVTRLDPTHVRLLAGAGSLLVINVGLPLGLQSGRYVVAHQATPDGLAAYALAMQLYTAAWGVLAVASAALWSAFVGLRNSPSATWGLWRRSTLQMLGLGVLFSVVLAVLGPRLVEVISQGKVTTGPELFVGFALLLTAQAAHLSSGAMLTVPQELRWQAICVCAMAASSIVLSLILVPVFGPPGAAFAAGFSVLACQVAPDVIWGRVLIHRRELGGGADVA